MSIRFTTDCPKCDRTVSAWLPEETKLKALSLGQVSLHAECWEEEGGCAQTLFCLPKMDNKGKITERWFQAFEV
jgi:hypothetical protein